MMEENKKYALLLFLLNYLGEINGRTRIQKMLYLTDQIGWNAVKDYHFYQYGPYSQWLKRALDLLENKKLIEEKQEEIDEGKFLYKYKITEIGLKFLQKLDVDSLKLTDKTTIFLDALKKYRTDDLELMSSLYFIKKSDPEVDTDEKLVKVIHLHKPRFSPEQIEQNLRVFPLMEQYAVNQN